jgi:hypothetical protein
MEEVEFKDNRGKTQKYTTPVIDDTTEDVNNSSAWGIWDNHETIDYIP